MSGLPAVALLPIERECEEKENERAVPLDTDLRELIGAGLEDGDGTRCIVGKQLELPDCDRSAAVPYCIPSSA